jgi:hypothetical protein
MAHEDETEKKLHENNLTNLFHYKKIKKKNTIGLAVLSYE